MIICEFEEGNKAKLRHVTVNTVVIQDGKVLLVKRNKKLVEGGKWSLVGGFMGRDETVREAAKREAFEESGWRVSGLTLLRIKDNPNRPHEDRQNISFSFFAKADKKEGEKDWESDEVKWFDLDNLPKDEEIAFDHSEDIKLYKKYINENFSIPILI